jgi:hypothetical protein
MLDAFEEDAEIKYNMAILKKAYLEMLFNMAITFHMRDA